MSDEETAEREKMFFRSIKKRIVPFEEDNPAIEPIFVNYSHGVAVGGAYYIDVGVITLESFSEENKERVADFAVIHRLVMTKEALLLLQEQIKNLLDHGEPRAPISDGT